MTEARRLDERRRENLARRASALRAMRGFFDARRFLEVETPLLVPSPGLELHLEAFPVEVRAKGAAPWYLITSPEYQLKRLLAAGLPRIYAVARSFRRGELGPHHNPEFTLIEWYRAPGGWSEIADDVADLAATVATALLGTPRVTYRGQPIDLTSPWPRLTVREAMERFAGVRVDGDEPAAVLLERGRAAGHALAGVEAAGAAWDDVFFSIFLDAVEPQLGRGRPTVLCDWPAPLAALARPSPTDARVVERFEAYAGGLELCNGFGELVDGDEQRRRFAGEIAERARRGLAAYPVDERFLAALDEGLPPSAGVALGWDRLLMLLCDAATLAEVCAFTWDEL